MPRLNSAVALGRLPMGSVSISRFFSPMAAILAILLMGLISTSALADGGAVMSIHADDDRFYCGHSLDVTFAYTPDQVDTPVLRGYSLRIIAPHGLTFTSADIQVLSPLTGVNDTHLIIDHGEGDCTVDFTFLKPDEGLSDTADLFTITMRDRGFNIPNTPVAIESGIFRTPENQDIPVDISDIFLVDVICVAPTPPTLGSEPAFTPGTTNTLTWSDEAWAGAFDYNVELSTDSDFATIDDESGWIAGLNHQFTGLVDGQQYYFRAYSRNFTGRVSVVSNIEQSIQDALPPVTSPDPLAPDQFLENFEIPFQTSDNLSGFKELDLFYRFEGGLWNSFGTFEASPIIFTATDGDGFYEFFTSGVDVAGNAELPPAGAQASTTLDTTRPFGTFVANDDAVATNDPNVMLTNSVVRAIQMRFSNNNATWPEGWVAFNATHSWVIPSTEEIHTVYGQFRDGDGQVLSVNDAIEYDVTPPGGVSNPSASADHESVLLTWTNPVDPDFHQVEVWRGLLHDGANNSTYPSYSGGTVPTSPVDRDAAQASPEWELAGLSSVGANSYTDAVAERGIYFYEFFAIDPAVNYSVSAGSLAWATNYVLGDVAPPVDGQVTIPDMTLLGSTYGLADVDPQFIGSCDVAPTSTGTGSGIPFPDGVINFNDQMIFGMNYTPLAKNQNIPGNDPVISERVSLAWRQIEDGVWSLDLVAPYPTLKGVGLAAGLPAGVVATLTPGEAMTALETPFSLLNIDRNGLDAGLVVLGAGRGLTSTGPLLTVTVPANPRLDLDTMELRLDLRDINNRSLEVDLDGKAEASVPTSLFLAGAFPNPFNPSTTLKFSLPADMPVRLEIYGADGRRVAVLVDETLNAGFHEAVWLGRDDAGRQVASGVYFSRLLAGPQSQVQKMTLMK